MACWVVKIGGSLFGTQELHYWVDHLVTLANKHCIIVVPGGGPFANLVRTTQAQLHFNNQTAHHMAILAMSQFGLVISSMASSANFFTYPTTELVSLTGLHIWLPDHQVTDEPCIEQNWSVTSDTLALWLSQKIDVDELHLVKSIATTTSSIKHLSDQGVLDASFPKRYEEKACPVKLFFSQSLHDHPNQGLILQ